jgi:hypothetical protein
MRHFLLSEALALPVETLPNGVTEPAVKAVLVLAPGPALTLSPRCLGALLAAVPITTITGRAQVEFSVTSRTDPFP